MKLSTTTLLLAFFVSFAAAAPHAASISDSSPAFLERRTKTTGNFDTWYYGDSGPGQTPTQRRIHQSSPKHPCAGEKKEVCKSRYNSAMDSLDVACSLKGKGFDLQHLKATAANCALFEIQTDCIDLRIKLLTFVSK
jgi:hypothetical protein